MESTKKIKTPIRERIGMSINYFFITVIVLICLYPFLNVLAYALSSNRAILSGWVTFYPIEIQFQSFKEILGKASIWNAMGVTVTITIIGTVIALILTTCAAYALSRTRLKGKGIITGMILFTMYFGGGIIPTFLVIKNLGLLNSIWALILPSSINAFNFIVMRTFFRQIPDSLIEAAMIDGCNDIGILIKIVLPLSVPILATIGLFFAVEYWNEYFNAMMYINESNKFTLQLKLRQLIFTEELNQISGANLNAEGLGQMVMPESLKAASIIVATIPIILVYPWLQKYFVKGVIIGSIKG